jgi:hypothetical protein
MSIAREMADTVAECARTPGHFSIWSKRLGRYVCEKDPEFGGALAEQATAEEAVHQPISGAFKLVFLTAAGGTLLFVIICVVTTIIAGKDPPPLLEKTVTSLFDLAKIGFGAVVGLLGGQHLHEARSIRRRRASS